MSKQLSAPSPRHLVALGDSVATGANNNDTGYPALLQQKLAHHYPIDLHLLASNGQTSRQLMKSLPAIQQELSSADVVTVTIGGNDLRYAWRVYGSRPFPDKLKSKKMLVTLNTLTNNWNEIIRSIKLASSPRTRLIVFNLYNPYADTNPETREYIYLANAQLQNLCRMHNTDLIDTYTLLNKKSGISIQQYLSSDLIHLNQLGQEKLAHAAYRLIHPLPLWKKAWNLLSFKMDQK